MNKKILIIDHDRKDSADMVQVLTTIGYNDIVCVYTGGEGIIEADLVVPEIVIVALVLPDIKGFDVCKALRKISKLRDCKIILITGKLSTIDHYQKRHCEADEFITKTPSYESLISAVENN